MAASRAGRLGVRMTRTAAVVGVAVFMVTAFRDGWTRPTTDFPNYYTAAVLVRQGKPLRAFTTGRGLSGR